MLNTEIKIYYYNPQPRGMYMYSISTWYMYVYIMYQYIRERVLLYCATDTGNRHGTQIHVEFRQM